MKLRPVDSSVSFPKLEVARLDVWEREKIFERSVSERSPEKLFTFYDGPPFATGLPHYGHFVASIIKDIIPRYWSMQGYRVERRWGWDCHGLPVENEAQKMLGLKDKRDVDAYGIEGFNAACRSIVLRFTSEWETVIRRLGRWIDFENGYRTMDGDFMESVWWVFNQLWQKGLIYEGYRVQPISPALGTPLSNFEVAQGPQEKDPVSKKEGHKRRQDPSLTVRFRLEDEDANLWAWTTTPWTLPSNLALAVNPAVEYAKVRVVETGEVAYAHLGRLRGYQERGRIGEIEVLETLLGEKLLGRPYEPLFPYFEQYRLKDDGSRWAFKVVAADYVGTDAGTGIVHQAPAFGEDDYATGKREGLPLVNPLDLSGIFDETVPDFAGQFVKDADKPITAHLKAASKLVDQDVIVHATPHCYRTGVPLIYMAISTWFMRVEGAREDLVANNKQVRWVPEYVGKGRFGNWLESARDWNLSRNRSWGTPLPVWRCEEDPDEFVCVGSRAELEQLAGLEPGSIEDLHRDHIDGITFPSKNTPGGTMRRIEEVLDCWFESGSMPYAQQHYPFENRERCEQGFPADFIAEGLDQTRGWFYTLSVLSNALFGKPAFKNVIVNGIVLAEDGEKMSKSKQNFPDPTLVLDRFGSDALRLYLIHSPVVQGRDLRFAEAGVEEKIRSVLLPLWNAYSFLTRYAAIDGWEPDSVGPDPAVNELDGWVLSRTQSLVASVQERMAAYELFRVVPALLDFIDELTNWYIRRSRRRFWKQGGVEQADLDKLNAYRTLNEVLATLSRVLAPFLPFVSEEIYENLTGGTRCDSVHLDTYPEAQRDLIDEPLEHRMRLARTAVGLGRGLRAKHNMRVRQPLARMTLVGQGEQDCEALERAAELIADELNIKHIVVSSDETEFVRYTARPNLKLLGPKYGKQLGSIRAEVEGLESAALARVLAGESVASTRVEGLVFDSQSLLVDRKSLEGTVVDTADGVTVALDLELTDALRAEGLAREVINRVQNQRKDEGLDLDDRIQLDIEADGALAQAIKVHWALISAEVLGQEACSDLQALPDGGCEYEIEGHAARIWLKRRS
ncbi:MAG: isoleucyl-tRNA synthetase [Chlamydiales bacterium]|jgi:isoleucyl-tRNA synthetase